MIADTKPFIDLGWHTIKLGGELKRLPNGSKTIPIFGKDWLERALQNREMSPAPLGGAITGEQSGIIAIDCDNSLTYNLFKALDPDYQFHFMSKGKQDKEGTEQTCGTIVYKYTDKLNESFKISSNSLALDFLSNNRMTYLPTVANETKEPIDDLPELKEPPAEIIAMLQTMLSRKNLPVATQAVSNHKFNMNPLVDMFVRSEKVTYALFKLLTPKDFRDTASYKAKGYLHPNEVEEGRGSEYLSKVSAILGADASVDVELYVKAMVAINNQFETPMNTARLDATIIEPMCEGKATGIDGELIWKEDPDWSDSVMTFITKYGGIIHVFYDYQRRQYYVIDLTRESIQQFSQVQHLTTHIDSVSLENMKASELKAAVPNVIAGSEPEKLFGFHADHEGEKFNTFISTDAFKAFKNPEEYAEYYKRPHITLQFLETLVPDPEMRHYLLGFLRRKLDTFDYSPTILYFLGVAGSGKDTFVALIERIVGEFSLDRPSAKVFLEKNNAWVLDKLFVQLDEYGDTLNTYKDKQEALGLLKAYTGKPRVSVRVMRENTFSYAHKMTFIMTANHNPLMLDADDRRVALFDCPNVLKDADWIYAAGGMDTVIRQLEAETADFCYYLSTEVVNIDPAVYSSPPSSKNKEKLIAESMPLNNRIAYYLSTRNWKAFKEMADNYAPPSIYDRIDKDHIMEHDLVDMYCEMHGDIDGDSAKRRIRMSMKDMGLATVRTNLTGNVHAMMFLVPGARKMAFIMSEIEDE